MKAAWVLFVAVLPIVGILAYLIVRGDKLRAHQNQALTDQEAFRHYVQHGGGGRQSKTDELARLAELRDRGDISADEYQRLKAEIMDQDWTASGQ
jgi:hypothetical protein